MPQKPLDYQGPQRVGDVPAGWGTLLALAFVAPLLCVPAFYVGTGLLQDELVNGDGRSWQRAALRMAVPTALMTGASLLVAARALWRFPQLLWPAIVAVGANAAAIAFVVYATVTA